MNAPIEINPDLDASVHAELDAREGVVRIPDVVTPASAKRLNTPDVVSFSAAVTGESALTKIDAPATWFRPGDFLALHNDRRRRTPRGLHARPDAGLAAVRHVLTLFRTSHWPSEAPVAADAWTSRLSITGWLRDDPPVGAA